jgi:hypothetical protein
MYNGRSALILAAVLQGLGACSSDSSPGSGNGSGTYTLTAGAMNPTSPTPTMTRPLANYGACVLNVFTELDTPSLPPVAPLDSTL